MIDHAPYVHLFSREEFWPSDLGDHLVHTTPHGNYTMMKEKYRHPNLTNLNDLNELYNCLALHAIANVGGREMGEALSSDVHRLLISP